MRNFIKINKGNDFYGNPGIEAYFVKSVLSKYNYKAKFSNPDNDGVITVDNVQDFGLKPLEKIYEYLSITLLVIADLKQISDRKYL